MVTRSLAGQNLRRTTQELGAFRSTVTGTILPVLGLSAALGVLNGGFNDATASGRAASSAGYRLQTSMYGLQDAITRALLPAIEAITPFLSNLIDRFVALNEQTNGWALNLAALGGAAFLARRPLLSLLRLLGLPIPGLPGGGRGAPTPTGGGGRGRSVGPRVVPAPLAAAGAAVGAAGAAGLGLLAGTAITGNYGPARAVDRTLRTEAAGEAVQGILPYQARPLEGGLIENAARFYREGAQDAFRSVRGIFEGVSQPVQRDFQEHQERDPIGNFFRRDFENFGTPETYRRIGGGIQQGVQQVYQPVQRQTERTTQQVRDIIINAPGVVDTDGLLRQVQEFIDTGLLRGLFD